MSDNANWMDRLVVGSMCHCDDPDDCFDHWELFVLPPGVEMDDEGHVGRAQTMDEAMLRRLVALAKAGTTPTEPASVVGGGAELIAAERLRQVTAEGWTPEHDAEHTDGSMVRAAVCYASYGQKASAPYPLWPWADSWWKPSDDPIKNLVRAGALIAAEIDRIDGTTPTEAATSGLEPGEIVAVPADLRDASDGVQWECYFAGYWLPVQADDTARRICRPITEEGQS